MNGLRTCLSWVMLSALFHVAATGDPVIELRPISASGAHVRSRARTSSRFPGTR